MARKTKESAQQADVTASEKFSLQNPKAALDPTLSSLFSSSFGPVKSYVKYAPPAVTKTRLAAEKKVSRKVHIVEQGRERDQDDDEELSEISEELDDEAGLSPSSESDEKVPGVKKDTMVTERTTPSEPEAQQESRKRKRNRDNEDLEGVYMQRLAREEAKEETMRQSDRGSKRQKQEDAAAIGTEETDTMEDGAVPDGEIDDLDDVINVPQHETVAPENNETELEKASRTVFLGNVSTTAITSKSDRKILLHHLASFISALPVHEPPHKVESMRFRSTAYSSNVPKKAAFVKKELMDTTTKSTNAYVVYSTNKAAREAAQKLNGTVVLGRHLRVDEVAHPAKIDHKRCIFVGNLGFVDDDSQIKAAAAELAGKTNSRPSKPQSGDVEEGLWQHFSKAGKVESVRVVRDPKTRVGKGFAYVQFTDQNAVETALLDNDNKFPPLLPRKLRVVRAKKMFKKPDNTSFSSRTRDGFQKGKSTPSNRPNIGRANKLLGRAGAAASTHDARRSTNGARPGTASNNVEIGRRGDGAKALKPPESFVFEGHRASSTQGKGALRLGKSKSGKKKAGKPRDRSAKRGAAWKATGGRGGSGGGNGKRDG